MTAKLNDIKICIGLPVGKDLTPEFLNIITNRYLEWTKKYTIIPVVDIAKRIDVSRNNIVNIAKSHDCDYLFFIDTDVLIEKGYLERLLSHNKDVITGIYHQKPYPHYTTIFKREGKYILFPLELEGDNIEEIDASGMGCFLIKMNLFDKISYPWFEFKYFEYNGVHDRLGEDICFCEKLGNIGTKIYCDSRVRCTHCR